MAWGSKKEEMIAQLAEAQTEARLLREQVTDLKQRLSRTQDALIAKESPEAYIDQRVEAEQAKGLTAEQLAMQDKARREAEINSLYLSELEAPLFKDAEDMQQILTRAMIKPPGSLHDNGES